MEKLCENHGAYEIANSRRVHAAAEKTQSTATKMPGTPEVAVLRKTKTQLSTSLRDCKKNLNVTNEKLDDIVLKRTPCQENGIRWYSVRFTVRNSGTSKIK